MICSRDASASALDMIPHGSTSGKPCPWCGDVHMRQPSQSTQCHVSHQLESEILMGFFGFVLWLWGGVWGREEEGELDFGGLGFGCFFCLQVL